MSERNAWVCRIGLIDYQKAFELQNRIHTARKENNVPDVLLLLEHPPVITLGRGAKAVNLLLSGKEYHERGITVVETDRGGDVTFHEPGQLVGYPIFDLKNHGKDLHLYLRKVEQAVIDTLAGYGISSDRFPPHTGVWVDKRKVCAIGIRVSYWISMHGFALNVSNDLSGFQTIVPCGLPYPVTSVAKELGKPLTIEDLYGPVTEAFSKEFELTFEEIELKELEKAL